MLARGFNVLVWVGGGEAEVNVGAEDLATGGRGVSDFLVGPIALTLHGCEAVWWLSEGPRKWQCTCDVCLSTVGQPPKGETIAKPWAVGFSNVKY